LSPLQSQKRSVAIYLSPHAAELGF
jgi:hypothetical protein